MSAHSVITKYYESFRGRILNDSPFDDFKEKHLFVARMRILLFLGTWVAFFVFYPEIWSVAPLVPVLFNLSFFVTALSYWNILTERYIVAFAVAEIVADIVGQVVIIYVLGLDNPAPFLFFGLYVTGAGSLFGYYTGLFTAFTAFTAYALLFILIQSGVLPAFYYPPFGPGLVNMQSLHLWFNIAFLPFALTFIIYGLRIVRFFSQRKQKALERRHIQLTALNNIGSTIRKALQTREVIDQVLRAVTKGLRFEVCILALVDPESGKLKFYVADENYYARKMQEILGLRFADIHLPLHSDINAVCNAIDRKRVIIRNHFVELSHQTQPAMHPHKCLLMQSRLGFKKFIITPLIAEQKGIGAIIGASMNDYVEDTVIDTLDNFSNQAALAIESAQLFETLEEKNLQLTRANQVKSDFLAIMSHELRTPLIAVIGYSELLLERIMGDLNDDQSNSVREVLRNAKNLLELINSVLDLAKIESGKMEIMNESFDLADLVREVEKTVKPLMAKKNQNFKLENRRPDMPPLVADSIKVRQMLINLIGNAIKFTGESGSIRVGLDYAENGADFVDEGFSREIQASGYRDVAGFLIEVSDDGVGIRSENLKKIFDVFSQVDASYTRSHEGTGLGLALTKQLVLLHGGAISVASDYGKGSRFRILLPQGI